MDVSDLLPTDDAPVAATDPATTLTTMGPTWQEQDGLLRDLWLKNEKPEVISAQLNRSIAAIMTRAARLGLPRRTAPGRKPGRRMNGEIDRTASQTETMVNPRVVIPRVQESLNAPPATSLRICLMCLNKFESFGRHNRICTTCKNSSEYESASSLAEIHLPSA